MTRPALIKSADLKRMAAVAKSAGVRVEIEREGLVIRVSPDIPAVKGPAPLVKYEDFDL